VDNILIDEARTPLIISGPGARRRPRVRRGRPHRPAAEADVHFEVNEKDHTAT
jgi:preprotein translocase subunit SecA